MNSKIERVLVVDNVDKVCDEILKDAGLQVTSYSKLAKDDLLREIKDYDALIVRSATKVTADVLRMSERLKLVGRAGTGVDNIDVDAATRRGIMVMNTPGGNTISAAEHTCAMILALSRSIPSACASLKEGKWDRKLFMGNELYGKTLGIVGLGRIGFEVAKRMQPFGVETIGYDPIVPAEVAAQSGIKFLPLKELWPKADYITVHTPLLPQTQNLINEDVLNVCKKGVRIVNVARGGIVDEEALLNALESGICGGAAIDVFVKEPPADFHLCQHPKVICTPHLGANTFEGQHRVAVEMAQQIVDMVNQKPVMGLVNAPTLRDASSPAGKPWIQLSESLGCLSKNLIQVTTDDGIIVNIDFYGSQVSKMSKFLSNAVLVGLLKGSVAAPLNLVNAELLAEEMGLQKVVSIHEENPPISFAGPEAVQIQVTKGEESHTLLGSSVSNHPVLYALDGCTWQSGLTLGRNMLFYKAAAPVFPLVAIASELKDSLLESLHSSSPGGQEVCWHVARTTNGVLNPQNVPETQLVAQVSF